jgi:hypothetical protein
LFASLALWFTLGGHYGEVLFLNVVRFRLPVSRSTQIAVRLAFWFLFGCLLFLGMNATARLLSIQAFPYRRLWIGGCVLVGAELVVHLLALIRRKPNFYDGTA